MPVHRYSCPLRWADMDALGHVNNVTYVDYLQEARVDMLRAHAPVRGGEELAEGVVVVRHEVDYVRPLVFRRAPVFVDAWVTDVAAASFVLAYEVYDDRPGGREVYLRARSRLAPYVFAEERPRRLTPTERLVLDRLRQEPGHPAREPGARDPGPGEPGPTAAPSVYDCQVRFSDVDLYRHVNNVKYFEYLQEARIAFFGEADRPRDRPPLSVVVAAVDVDYRGPLLLRPEPYPVTTRVQRVGRSSFTLASTIDSGSGGPGAELARARATLVTFDAATQRATPLPDWVRAHLERAAGEATPGVRPQVRRR